MDESLPQYVAEFRQAIGDRSHSEIAREIGVHRSTITSLYNNKVLKLDRVDPRSRKKIWDKFKIQSFYDSAFDPISSEDDFPLRVKKFVIKHYETIDEAAKYLGVHYTTINNIFHGKNIKKSIADLIDSKIRLTPTQTVQTTQAQQEDTTKKYDSQDNLGSTLRKIRDDLDSITLKLAQNSQGKDSADLLSQQYRPTLEQRICSVDIALRIIADELDYFREASTEERNRLAQEIDVDNFGYIVNILGGISKGSSHETWARRTPPPTSSKQWRKRK